jgi:hypothetical protein
VNIIQEPTAIDQALRQYPWLDLSIVEDDGQNLVIQGSLSETYPCQVRLIFEDVQCINARRSWRTNTAEQVFREIVDVNFNQVYGIEIGYRTFEFIAEDLPVTMRFVAKHVRLETQMNGVEIQTDLQSIADHVHDEKSFLQFLQLLGQDWAQAEALPQSNLYSAGEMGWENGSIGAFLEAASSWGIASIEGLSFYEKPKNPWQRMAQILLAGKLYE